MGIGNINALKPGSQDFWDEHDPSGGAAPGVPDIPELNPLALPRLVSVDESFAFDPDVDQVPLADVSGGLSGLLGPSPEGTAFLVLLDVSESSIRYYAGGGVTGQVFRITANSETTYPLAGAPIGSVYVLAGNTRDDSSASSYIGAFAGLGLTVEHLGFGVILLIDSEETAFEVVTPPTITSITPNSGTKQGGTSVEIVGAGFDGVESVRQSQYHLFTSVVVVDEEHITAVTEYEGADFTADVSVTTHGGTATLAGGYNFTSP